MRKRLTDTVDRRNMASYRAMKLMRSQRKQLPWMIAGRPAETP